MSNAKNLKEALERDLASLSRTRDELRVQLQLAKADARDDWKLLEQAWQRVENEIKRVGDHTKEPVKDIGEAARSLLGELKTGYERIKSQLKNV